MCCDTCMTSRQPSDVSAMGYPRDAPATVLFGEWFRFGKPSDQQFRLNQFPSDQQFRLNQFFLKYVKRPSKYAKTKLDGVIKPKSGNRHFEFKVVNVVNCTCMRITKVELKNTSLKHSKNCKDLSQAFYQTPYMQKLNLHVNLDLVDEFSKF
ncbi:hypothetical protein LXL04_022879 [Taraxacum kok-saghyz]